MGLDVCGHTHSESGRLPGVQHGVQVLTPLAEEGALGPRRGLLGAWRVPTWQCYGLPGLCGGHRSICHVISLCRLDIFYNKV